MSGTDRVRAGSGLDAWLSDPLVRLVMQADNVQASEIEQIAQCVRASRRDLGLQPGDRDPYATMSVFPHQDPRYRSGVGIMLLNARGEVFVGQRIRNGNRTWQMPQGGIDSGESPRDAALRELREEIGTDNVEILAESRGWTRYDLPTHLQNQVWAGRWQGQQQKWFAMRFLGSDSEIDLRTEHPEFSAWRWIPAGALPYLIVGFKREVYREVLRQFRGFQPNSEAEQETNQ